MIKEFNPFIVEFYDKEARVVLQHIGNIKDNIVVYQSSSDFLARDFCNHLNVVMNDRYHQHLRHMMISENIKLNDKQIISYGVRDTGVHQTINCDDDRDTIPGDHG